MSDNYPYKCYMQNIVDKRGKVGDAIGSK